MLLFVHIKTPKMKKYNSLNSSKNTLFFGSKNYQRQRYFAVCFRCT